MISGRLFTSVSQNFDVLSTFCGRKYVRLDVIQNTGCGPRSWSKMGAIAKLGRIPRNRCIQLLLQKCVIGVILTDMSGHARPTLIFFMIPRGRPSPQSKLHHDRFGYCRTGDRRGSLYFTMGRPFSPKNLPLPMGDLNPHLKHGPLGPPKSSTQRASWSVQPFLQGSLVWHTDRQTTLLGL